MNEKDPPATETTTMQDKDRLATAAIKKYSLYSAGAGLIPMPLIDWAAISAIQVKMLHDMAGIYEVPFNANRVSSILASLVGGWAGTGVGVGLGQLLMKAVPVVGPLISGLSVPATGAAATFAVGKVFLQHFATGGTLLDFDPEKMREHFRAEMAAKTAE